MAVIKKSQKAATKVAAFLKKGGVVICPTDTVYGFLADAKNKRAVAKIYAIKKRIATKPLPLFVANFSMAKTLAEISKDQEKVIKKYWPGKYTFILKRKRGVNLYGVDKQTVALRIPNHTFLNAVLKQFYSPISQTSVNISNQDTMTKIGDIINQFDNSQVLIIDAGNSKKGKSSTIFDLTHGKIKQTR